MIEALGYLWLRPYWLALVPLAIVLGTILVRRAGRLGAWERVVDPALLAEMHRMGRVSTHRGRGNWWPALVLAILGVALAGPAAEKRDTATYRNLDAVVLVLDLSPSIVEGGRLFDMLTTARLIADAAGTRQTAAIVYSGEAYVAAPFSTDKRALSGTLALLDGETMPVGGSRPETGLALAQKMLSEAQVLISDVVLISDGVGIGAEASGHIERLTASGATVSTVFIPGGDAGGAGALSGVSQAGGGTSATLEDPFPVARTIGRRPTERLTNAGYALLVLEDFGRFLLFAALIPAFLILPRARQA